MKLHLINSLEKLNEFSSSINALGREPSRSLLFNSLAWYQQWLETFWQEAWQLQAYIVFDHKTPIAFLPCYTQKSQNLFQFNTLYPLGQGEPESSEIASEYNDIYIAKGYENKVIQLLAKELKTLNIDQIIWRASLENSHINRLLNEAFNYQAEEMLHTRYLINKPTWSLSDLSKNTRSRYKRSVNQLNKINASFKWVDDSDYEKFAQILAEFHQTRWTSKGKDGAFAKQNFNDFHQRFRTENPESIRISAIIVNNTPIAINYYLADTTTLYFYQCGWDETSYANLSPGFALHVWSIGQCSFKYYDFMMGGINDSYKAKFGCQKIPMVNIHIIFSKLKLLLVRLFNKVNQINS